MRRFTAAHPRFSLSEATAWAQLEAEYQTAEQTWTGTEATAWATYSAAEQVADQAWDVAESLAWATYEAAAQAADQVWTAAEAAASAAFDAAMLAPMQAWETAESAAWAQYEADCLAAEQAWALAADAAMAEYYSDAAAAETTWNADEGSYRATLAADVADASNAWYADEASAFAVFEGIVGSEAGDYRQSLDVPWTLSEVTATLTAANAPDAVQPPAGQSSGGDTSRSRLPDFGNYYWDYHEDDPWWNGPIPELKRAWLPLPPSSSPPSRAGGTAGGGAPALPGQPRTPSLHEPHPIAEVGEGVFDAATGGITGAGRALGQIYSWNDVIRAKMEAANSANSRGPEHPTTKALDQRYQSTLEAYRRQQQGH